MAKKVSIAISHALTVSMKAPDVPPSIPHGEAPPDDGTIPHGEAPPDDGSVPHGEAHDSNPLSMLVNGPNEVFSVAHGVLIMDLPDAQKVSRVEIKRQDNGDLLITLIE